MTCLLSLSSSSAGLGVNCEHFWICFSEFFQWWGGQLRISWATVRTSGATSAFGKCFSSTEIQRIQVPPILSSSAVWLGKSAPPWGDAQEEEDVWQRLHEHWLNVLFLPLKVFNWDLFCVEEHIFFLHHADNLWWHMEAWAWCCYGGSIRMSSRRDPATWGAVGAGSPLDLHDAEMKSFVLMPSLQSYDQALTSNTTHWSSPQVVRAAPFLMTLSLCHLEAGACWWPVLDQMSSKSGFWASLQGSSGCGSVVEAAIVKVWTELPPWLMGVFTRRWKMCHIIIR